MTSLKVYNSHVNKPYTFTSNYDNTGAISHDVGDVQTPHQRFDPSTAFNPYFGIPKMPIYQRPTNSFDRENLRLPEAFAGQNDYLSEIIIRKITSEDRFPTRFLFPFKEQTNSQVVQWDTYTFGEQLLDRVPEEGVSRMLSSKKSVDSVTLHRQGIAFIMEHGFMKTPMGRMHYAASLEQIANAAIETFEFNAIHAACYWPLYEDPNAMYRNSELRTSTSLDRHLQESMQHWAIIQKSYEGLDVEVSALTSTMKNRRVNARHFIFPQGIRKYTDGGEREKYFMYSGLALGAKYSHLEDAMQPYSWFESREFVLGENQKNKDPLVRSQTIGGFFQVNDRSLRNLKPEEFTIDMLDTVIYNEDADDYAVIKYRDHWKDLGLFKYGDEDEYGEDDGQLDGYLKLSPIGTSYFAPYKSWGDYMTKTNGMHNFINSLHSKDATVHQYFLDAVVKKLGRDPVRSAQGERDAAELNQKFAGGMFFSHPNTTSSSSSSSVTAPRFNLSDSVADLKRQFPGIANVDEQAVRVVTFLHKLDDECKTNVLRAYIDSLVARTDSQRGEFRSIYEDVWYRLSPTLVQVDVDAGVTAAASQTSNPTPFESVYHTSQNAITRTRADEQGPTWRALGDRTPQIQKMRIYTNPVFEEETVTDLTYSSSAFTLTSTRVVLFALSEKELRYLIDTEGQVALDTSELPKGSPVRSDATRSALFQYSIALSAVFARIHLWTASATDRSSSPAQLDAATKLAVEDIKKILNPSHTGTDVAKYMTLAAKTAAALPILYSQRFAKSIITALQALLYQIYTNKRITGPNLNEAIRTAMEKVVKALQSEQFSIEEDGDVIAVVESQTASVGSRATRPHLLVERKERESPSSVAISKVDLERAIGKIKEIRKQKLATVVVAGSKTAASVDEVGLTDTYAAYETDMAEIWVLFHAHFSDPADHPDTECLKALDVADKMYHNKFALELTARSTLYAEVPLYFTWVKEQLNTLHAGDAAAKKTFLAYFAGTKSSNALLIRTLKERKLKRAAELTQNYSTVFNYYGGNAAIDSQRYTVQTQFQKAIEALDQASAKGIFRDDAARKAKINEIFPVPATGPKDKNLGNFVAGLTENTPINVSSNASAEVQAYSAIRLWAMSNSSEVSSLYHQSFTDASINYAAVVALQRQIEMASAASGSSESAKLTKERLRQLINDLPIEDSSVIVFCIEYNVWFGIGGLGLRPHQTYNMGTVIHLEGGENGAGRTLWGWPDFQLADNVAQKMHYGQLTLYGKTVIFKKQCIVHGRNVLCKGYIGGNGIRFFDHLDKEQVTDYRQNNSLAGDIFFVPVPLSYTPSLNFMDITGRFHAALSADETTQKATAYPSANIMREIWGVSNRSNPLETNYSLEKAQPRFNTLCFQEMQRNYSPATRDYTDTITNKGHFGERVYAGVRKVRDGYGKYFAPVKNDTNIQYTAPAV